MSTIRICQFFDLTDAKGLARYRYQNYFINERRTFLGQQYDFAPFQADGALASLNGENQQLRVLFASMEFVVRMVEAIDGNRLSALALTTAWLTASEQIITTFTDYYVGVGASYEAEGSFELRYRSSMDSVGAAFPGRTLTADNVGILPLNAELYLR
jgi:hypothetical protein